MTEARIMERLKETLSPHRYAHSLGVADTARELALRYGEDADRAYLAGLVHDCAKRMGGDELLAYARAAGMPIDEVERASPRLLHARIGRILAQEEFGIDDGAVLNAVERHIFGAPDMSRLDMIVNIADFIEPGRDFPGVERLRELAGRDLTAALTKAFRDSMIHILGKGVPLHPAMVVTYNAMLRKKA